MVATTVWPNWLLIPAMISTKKKNRKKSFVASPVNATATVTRTRSASVIGQRKRFPPARAHRNAVAREAGHQDQHHRDLLPRRHRFAVAIEHQIGGADQHGAAGHDDAGKLAIFDGSGRLRCPALGGDTSTQDKPLLTI